MLSTFAPEGTAENLSMSMDKSLKRAGQLVRQRSVLTRAERIQRLMTEDRWTDQSRPVGLPKVKVVKVVVKKIKKAKEEEKPEGEAAEAAAPAATDKDKKSATDKKSAAEKKSATEKK